ncbi:hypothetical protein O181_035742 [Austropuccinia psidii MF-1]|uniref:Retroviral polymerase SH3-like domain-containing protein n=1 Tax=Austropuccinia psidii MF-1 TaxID=1389203 RepID=A0A9Q3D5S9_9BASI|nr:hypothetical protein [Austropuccinia psidii MF-1]
MSFGWLPKTSHIHVFGCLTFFNKAKTDFKLKLESWESKGVFLGYAKGHNNYKVYNLETGKLQFSHDCVFLDKVMASNPSPRKEEFMSNLLLGGYQPPMFSSDASNYLAQDLESCTAIDLDTIFEKNTPRLLGSPVQDGSDYSSNSQEDFLSFQNSANLPVEAPSKSMSTTPEKLDVPNLPKGWVMNLVPDKAPKDISRNIVNGTRRTINAAVPSEGPPSHASSKGRSLENGN